MNQELGEAGEVRCPECGARNTADAQWCTQCYTPLTTPPDPAETAVGPADEPTGDPTKSPPPPPPPPSGAPSAVGDRPPPAGADSGDPDGLLPLPPPPPGTAPTTPSAQDDDTADASQPRELRSGEGRFRETDEGLEWVCAVCQEWNPIERVTCTVCSTPFGRTLGTEEAVDRPDVAPAVLTIASLVLPGAGHWLLRMRGAAVLRALLAVVWGLGGLTLFLRARASGQSFLPAVPLLLGWAVVAAGSANDAVAEAGGSGSKVLNGRVLLWLTLVVVGGTFAAVLVGVLSAVGQ